MGDNDGHYSNGWLDEIAGGFIFIGMIKLRDILYELLISEALPPDVLAAIEPFTSITRSASVQNRMNSIFKKLAALPNVIPQSEKDRVYLPFSSSGTLTTTDSPVKKDIESALQGTEYTLKNYTTGLASDRYGRDVKLGKVLTKLGKQDLVNKFNSDDSRESSRKGQQVLVFSKRKEDVAAMSTGRGWTSCMDVFKKDDEYNKSEYIRHDIKEGTIICYLTDIDDIDIDNPTARVLIKPYINIANKNDVLYYPEQRTSGYGTAPSNFVSTVTDIVNDIQGEKGGRFEMVRTLYCDSPGNRSLNLKTQSMQSYTDGTDSVKTKKEIEKLLEYLGVSNFVISSDLTVDVNGSVDLRFSKLKVMPVKFRNVTGDFSCEGNQLTSFNGVPEKIGGDFRCNNNKINSPQGAPREVSGQFVAFRNDLSDSDIQTIKQNTTAKRFEFE